jgi:hypothetical protein
VLSVWVLVSSNVAQAVRVVRRLLLLACCVLRAIDGQRFAIQALESLVPATNQWLDVDSLFAPSTLTVSKI